MRFYFSFGWIIFFFFLLFGIKSNKEVFNDSIEGSDPGAPKNSKIAKKFLIITIITSILFIMIYYIVDLGLFNLRNYLQ